VNFCPECGAGISLQTLPGDERQRFVCGKCRKTHYENPNILVAAYVCVAEQILWIRRGNAPGVGKWALPGGYMENNESPEVAACREVREETGIALEPDLMTLISVSSIPHMAQTHLVFRCHLSEKPATTVTEEALDIDWFDEGRLPWADLAFPTIEPLVRQIYGWLDNGNFGIRVGSIGENSSRFKTYSVIN